MPVSNLKPNNISGVPYSQWQLQGMATKVLAVEFSDGTAGYIRAGGALYRDCFNVAWPTAPAVGKVNSIKAYGVVRYATTSHTVGIGVRNASGETCPAVTTTTSFQGRTTAALARPGGGSWTKDDCANGVTYAQVRITASDTSGNGQCTQLYLILDYDTPGEAFITYWSWLLPLLGSALTYGQFCGALDLVARVHPTVRAFSERDKREMWRAFCGWQRPTMVWGEAVGTAPPVRCLLDRVGRDRVTVSVAPAGAARTTLNAGAPNTARLPRSRSYLARKGCGLLPVPRVAVFSPAPSWVVRQANIEHMALL